jgi:NhaA family Na+:H+ antiporter
VGELAFGAGSPRDEHVKLAVLVGSLASALLATVVLRTRNRVYQRLAELEARDDDGNGIPDCFEASEGASDAVTGVDGERRR